MPERSEIAAGTGLALGWGVSIALHACVIGAGSVLVWSIHRERDEPYATEATTVVFDSPGLSPAPVDTRSPSEPSETPSAIDRLFEPSDAAAPSPIPMDATPIERPPAGPDAEARDEPPDYEPPAIERDAEFFGTGASDAKRIVYVVDASGSSIALFPAIVAELRRSLDGLNATQHATVLAALGTPASGDREARHEVLAASDGLVRTTRRGAERLADWFASEVTPRGRSDLLEALGRALAHEPDAVFLVASPGNASTLREGFFSSLDALNPVDARTGRRRAMIRVVSIGPAPAGDPLVRIEREHGSGGEPTVKRRSDLLEGVR